MRKGCLLLIAAFFISGCATSGTWQSGRRSFERYPERPAERPAERQPAPATLAPAVARLSKGDATGAAKVLKGVCQGKRVRGTTDEALFRLALLSLNPNPDMPVSKRGRQLLQRLKREYPASPWTAQAAQLMELVKVTDELTRQNQDLKAAKETLYKENNELSGNIDRLRKLDLELESTR